MSEAVRAAISAMGRVVKGIIEKGTNQNGTDGRKKGIIIGAIIGVLLFLLIIPMAAISAPGIIVKNTFEGITDQPEFNQKIDNTEIYRKCQNVYKELENDYNKKVSDIVEDIKRNNPVGYYEYKVERKNKKGYDIISVPIAPTVNVSYNYTMADMNYLLAYINTMYFDNQSGYKFNKSEARDFLDSISELKTSYTGTDPIYLSASNTVLPLDVIADKYFTDVYTSEGISKRELFIESYKGLLENSSR